MPPKSYVVEENVLTWSHSARWHFHPSHTEIMTEAMTFLHTYEIKRIFYTNKFSMSLLSIRPRDIEEVPLSRKAFLFKAAVFTLVDRLCHKLNAASLMELERRMPNSIGYFFHALSFLETWELAAPLCPIVTQKPSKAFHAMILLANKIHLMEHTFPEWSLLYKPLFDRDDWPQKLSWRQNLGKWILNVAKEFGLTIACVADSFAVLDFALAHDTALKSSENFQLAALTAMCIAMRAQRLDTKQVREVTSTFSQMSISSYEEHLNATIRVTRTPPHAKLTALQLFIDVSCYNFVLQFASLVKQDLMDAVKEHFLHCLETCIRRVEMHAFSPFTRALSIFECTMHQDPAVLQLVKFVARQACGKKPWLDKLDECTSKLTHLVEKQNK